MEREMILRYNRSTGKWEATPEPYAIIEVETAEQYECIKILLDRAKEMITGNAAAETKPLTNHELIKTMDVKQLAKFLNEWAADPATWKTNADDVIAWLEEREV